jgi:hypothetical protein
MRDGTFAPPEMRAGATMMLHFRQAIGAPAEIAEMRPGKYTICVVPLPVKDPAGARMIMEIAEQLPMKCEPITVGESAVASTIVVPFAWTQPGGGK